MKTTRFLAILAAVILGFVACEKKDNTQNIESDVITEQAYADLFQQLDAYNSTFEFDSSNGYMQKKGGFWDWLKRVVSYDASGTIVGAIVAGTPGSIACGVMFSLYGAVTNPYSEDITSSDFINKPTFEIVDNEVGVWHNRIIEEVLTDYPDMLNGGYTENELIEIIGGKLELHNISTTKELENIYNGKNASLIKEMTQATDAQAITISMQKAYPALQKEIQVLDEYMTNVERNTTLAQKVEYTEGVVRLVNNSNIPLQSKQMINSAASVHINSTALWGEP